MARDSFNEQKNKNVYSTKKNTKKKDKKTTKTVVKKPQSSSVSKETKQEQRITQKTYGQPTKPAYKNNKAKTAQKQQTVENNTRPTQTVARQSRERTADTSREMMAQRSNATTTAAQRQKMGVQTKADEQAARDRRRQLGNSIKSSVRDSMSEDNRSFAQRQKSGTMTAQDEERVKKASERRKEVARNTGAAVKKATLDTVSGYGQTLADVDEMAKSNRNWTTAKAQKMGIDLNDRARVSKVEQERQQSIREARKFQQELFDKQEQRQAEWDERTKNAKGLEKAWYGAVESGTGMLLDTAVGAATGTGQFGSLASMGLRTYGSSANQARKEGATDKEARLYGLASAGKEVGTELMFQGAGLAKAAYGKTGLSLADKSANILTKGLTGLKADAVGAGVRALGGTAEENVEELAGWMADPIIKELTYGKNVRNRMKENLRANIPQIGSDADAANVASYFSTPQFTDELTSEYVKSGLSKEQASELAAEMRDYYVAYYSGDNAKLDALETDLAAKLSGQDKLSTKSWSMDELKDTFASTTLLTLATGIPGAVNTSVKGNRIFDSDEVKAVFGDDAVRKVADAVKNTSDKEMSLKAETMKDRLDSGKDLTGTQKYDLYQGYLDKVNETAKKAKASYGVVENAREAQDLVPTMGRDRTGNTVYAKATQREFNEKFASTELTVEALKNYMESDNSISDDESRRANAVKKAVADIHVGGLTVGDAHEFAYGNTLAREALKAEEGIDLDQYIVRNADGTVDLSATNEATENALFQMNADNAIKAAQVETEVFKDDYRGDIDRDVMSRFGNNGQAIWKEVNKDLDPRDLQNYLTTANAASYFYSAGRNTDMGVDEAVNRYADTFKTVDNSVLKRAYAAGARDRIIANTPGYGQTVESGSNIQLKKTKPIITGQLIMDKDVVIPDSDQSAYLALAMSTNTNIHIVSSLKSKQGVEINGMSHGNDIYLNMNAAAESNLGYVFMHEMTHQIKQYAPNEYLALENLVRDRWFNKDQKGMQKAIKDRIDLYLTKGGQQLTEEEAVEEIIADAMAEAMDDPDFAAQVCEEDINLGQAILNSIREALRSIRNMFANNEFKNERFHNSLLSYLDILDEAEKMWLNALATARQNKANGLIADWQDRANKQNSPRLSVTEEQTESMETTISDADRKTLNNEGIEELDDGTTARYSVTSWGETNKDKKLKALVAAGHNKEVASKWIDDVNSIASIILDDPERLDYEADRTNKFLKPNGDYYKYTLDASTLCDKRRIYQGTYNAIQHIIPNAPLMQDDVVRIRTLLKNMDHKAPCGICYVESQRKNLGQYAKEWYDSYARKDEIKLADVTTSDGLKELKKTNPEVASDFEKAMAAKGVSSPKVVKLRTDYREDIMRMRPATIEYLNSIGGLRFHSFSDFETPHLIDTMQAVMDMATKNLMGMAYAKVPNFAAVFGPTGIKINLSLIAKTDENGNAVHDENGRLVFDSVEGIPFEEASKWRDAYPDNVAFILVGKDKEHTLEAINDDRVDFVIPFHRSKWSAEDMRRLGLVGYEDFATGHQENGVFVSEFWDYNKTGKENAERYLEVCKEKGVTPIFEQLLKENEDGTYSLKEDGSTDNYWKLLVEGKMYNHFTKKGAPQKPVQPNFNMDEARRVLNEYEGGANTLPVADDVVKAFIKEYKQNHPDVEIADARLSISVEMDDDYMAAVNSGDMDEAQRLVDEAAKMAGFNSPLLYHGTPNFGFTVFDGTGFRDHDGWFFSDRKDAAESYAYGDEAGTYSVYLNLENPLVIDADGQDWTDIQTYTSLEARDRAKEIDARLDEIRDAWRNGTDNGEYDRLLDELDELDSESSSGDTDSWVALAKENGHDGLIIKNIIDYGASYEGEEYEPFTEYIAFNQEQIKSADAVTYAEDGSVIPLSKRFDPSNNDIRYSLPTQDSKGRVLSDGQMEYFANSQARDEQGRLVPVYHTTNYGGFTIFDPSYSDDKRSLFFASNFDVSQTYGRNANKPIDIYNDINSASTNTLIDRVNNTTAWNIDRVATEDDFKNEIKRVTLSDDDAKKYGLSKDRVEKSKEYVKTLKDMLERMRSGEDFFYSEYNSIGHSYGANSMIATKQEVIDLIQSYGKGTQGYYSCYLNLENPLIVDAHGANWSAIKYGNPDLQSKIDFARQELEMDMRTALSSIDVEFEYNDDGFPIAVNLEIAKRKSSGPDWFDDNVADSMRIAIEDYTDENGYYDDPQASIDMWQFVEAAISLHVTDSSEFLNWIEDKIDFNGDIHWSSDNLTGYEWFNDHGEWIGEEGYIDEETINENYGFMPTYTTRELAEMASANGHDGVVIRNCRDIGGASYLKGNNPISDIFIAFSSNQVKDINNENPTENPDIRYSIPSKQDVLDYIAANAEDINDVPMDDPSLEQNRQEQSEWHENFVRDIISRFDEGSLTFGMYLDEDSVKNHLIALMKQVMSESGTGKKYRADTLQSTIDSAKVMFYDMQNHQIDNAAETAWRAAQKIVDDIDYNDDLYVQYKGMRNYLDRRKIIVPEGLEYDESFAEFAEDNRDRMRFVGSDKKGMSVDTAYKYLAKKYPQLFPAEMETPIDKLLQIDYALDYTTPYREAYSSEEYSKLVATIAGDLMDIVSEGESYRTVADKLTDKYEGQIKAMKQRHEEALRKVKETEKEKRDATREVWAKIAQRWKDKYNERIQKDKAERKAKADKREHLKSYGHIAENYNKLCTWVLKPTKEKNVPEEFRKSLAEFLQALDLQTENSKKLEAKTGRVAQKTLKMRELKDRLNDLATRKGEDGSSVWDVDASIAFLLEKLSDKLDENGNSIDALDSEDIKTIDVFMQLLIRNIERYKQVKMETKNAELSDIGGSGVEFLKAKIDRDGEYRKRKGLPGTIAEINAAALTPAYLFDRMGPLKEMYDVLRHNGFDAYIRNEKMIMDRLEEILGKYYRTNKKGQNMPGSIIEEWRDERSAQTIELANGKTVTMSIAQIMSLRCLAKRGEQAMGHMMVGGIVVEPIQTTSKLTAEEKKNKGKAGAIATRTGRAAKKFIEERTKGVDESVQKYVLTYEDILNIISKLTPEQANIADKLQELMSVDMAKLGNEAHRELYGYEMFGEDNYFPIKVHGNERSTDINNIGEVIEKIKSFGFTKPLTPKAKQAIEVDDIFSVVADHCNGMNLYNAYLVPITDFMKVLNYTHTFENGDVLTMKEAIEQAYGKDMLKYILNLMKDINGIKESNRGGLESIMNKALGRAKRTAVFGNVRVALQQPTAIVRAAAEINPKYIKGALHLDSVTGFIPEHVTATMEEMWKYCPIAQWKSWGYYDTYMGRDIEDVMMNQWSVGDKVLAGYYGQLDNASWSIIWQAVKAEQAEKYPKMDHKSEEFLQICGRRASEVFDKTQVVDSTFHRSDAMRSKQIATKLFTAFMAEPTLTLNVFRAGLFNAAEAKKAGNTAEAGKILGRAVSVIVVQAAVVSAAQAFADAWRGKDPGLPWDDDDDEEKVGYWWRWIHNFVYNGFDQLHLENNMYLVKDVTPYLNYTISQAAEHWDWNPTLRALMGWDQDYLYSQNNLVFAGLENTANGIAQLFKKLEKGDEYVDYKTKEPKKWYDIIQKIMSGIGTFTGIPVGTLMRDFKPLIEKFLPAVYAADIELMDAVANKMGYKPIEGRSESKGEPSSNGKYKDDLLVGIGLGKTAEEKAQAARDKKIKSIYDKYSDLSGEERDKKVWSAVTSYYKNDIENGKSLSEMVEEGRYDDILQMKLMYQAAGGDRAYFEERVMAESKSALKKSIVYNQTQRQIDAQQRIIDYMSHNGMSEYEISEIAYHSVTARDLKVAFRINDKALMLESLRPLVYAGLTYDDLVRIWDNRNRVDLVKYKKNGRYKDKLKSTGTFVWPTQGTITSHFGYRNAPTRGASSNHPAIDIGAPTGTPVAAADGGVVIYAGSNGGYGNSVGIKHDNGWVTYYNHLSGWNVQVGDTVAQGQQIAAVGSTGISTGPHLDFKVLDTNNKPVDPEKYLNSKYF